MSCQLLKRHYDDVELYTDKAGYELLIEKLKLPYSKVHVVLDELNHYSSAVWALSKIRTYSLQDAPFIHIDGDVFLWKKFPDRLVGSDLIIQNREIGNQYFDTSWKTLEEQLSFIPDEIRDHRQKENAVNVYNFGIFGGQNTDLIKHYAQKAFDFVDQNIDSLDSIKHLNFNIFFEQYLFYCMAQDQQVSSYFEHDIIADKYEGLANFQDVPTSRSYLHLLGDYKKKEEICRNMSRQLAVEFPEQYATCLKVLGSNEQAIFNVQYQSASAKTSIQEKTSFTDFYQSISPEHWFPRTQNAVGRHPKPHHKKEMSVFRSKDSLQELVTTLDDAEIQRAFDYEQKIDDYLNSLTSLDFNEHAQWEYHQTKLYLKFLENPDVFQFRTPSTFAILQEPFLFGDPAPLDTDDITASLMRLIQPSSNAPYFKEIVLDTLDEIIYNESKSGTNIQELILTLQNYFDQDELKSNYESYKQLIQNTVKRLIYAGVLHLVDG